MTSKMSLKYVHTYIYVCVCVFIPSIVPYQFPQTLHKAVSIEFLTNVRGRRPEELPR